MDNLRKVIELLFCQISPKEVIFKWLQEDRLDYTNDIPQNVFVNQFEALHTEKNQDEINAIYHLAFSDWNKLPETFSPLGYKNQSNVFFILVKFLREILYELSELPVCHFQYLFRWRDISLKIGEDILTTSFFAYKDIVGERDRHFFSWPSVVSTDNLPLSEILSKGVTDLHFHLVGSSLNFDIGWISLMNNIKYRKDDFEKLLNLRYPYTTISQEDRNNWSLYILAVKACAIRQFLFRLIIKEFKDEQNKKCFWEKYKQILLCDTEDEISLFVSEIQDENERLRFSYGKYYSGSVADYAINRAISAKNESDVYFHNTILYGERWMLYKMFRYIFQGNSNDKNSFRPLFYAYLLIKTRIRNEFVQVNNYLGFQNFKDYQDRKVLFIKPGSVYEKLLVNLAIKNSIISQNVSYLEVRIPPYNTISDNIRILKFLDKCANDNFDELLNFTTTFNEQPCFYYIFHFLKHEDKGTDDSIEFLFQPRHFHLRKKIKEQVFAINNLRKQYGNIKERIVGVDTAGAEIGCRPEVFAQAYRYLKKYSCELEQHFLENKSLNSLGYTYHVGEDFMDIADGLRAIDEAIIFLNLRSGDRLGHCLALGIYPEQYYKKKNYHIIISKQDLLDNIVWLLMQIQIYDISCSQSLLLELRQIYFELYSDIYCFNSSVEKWENNYHEQLPQFTPYHIYYLSWLLRGDDPCLYKDKSNDYQSYSAFKYWDMCGENRFTEQLSSARSNEKVRALYHRYHYDAHVRRIGALPFEFKISKDYIQLIKKIQNRMMFDISKKQISIECNPTSNKLIGGFEFYSDLPLKRFFNLGLTYNHDELSGCPQISSSINTDDLGIFSTSISNEYALMALAIEKMKNEDGTKKYNTRMVYDWLERIRVMGFEQRFKK